MRGFVLSRFHLTGEGAAENAARSQRQSQTAIGLIAKNWTAISLIAKSRQQKARDVETFRAFALISSQMQQSASVDVS